MQSAPPAPPSARGDALGWLLLALTALAAYAWPLAQALTRGSVEAWLFRPGAVPLPLAIGAAGFAAWRGRHRILGAPQRPAPVSACAWIALGAGLFLWAHLTGATYLLLAALGAQGIGLAAGTRGWVAARACLVPVLLLLLGTPLPKPIEDEVVWQLQRGTAAVAGWLLALTGQPFEQLGVMLSGPDHAFHVIDGCSGLSGVTLLLIVSLIVRELLGQTGLRGWLLVGLAIPVGFALNAIRVAWVASAVATPEEAAAASDHTGQGVAVLMAGSAILYGIGLGLARSDRAAPTRPTAPLPVSGTRRWVLGLAAVSAGLALGGALLPRFAEAGLLSAGERGEPLPEALAGWEALPGPPPKPEFNGILAGGLYRRYRLDPGRERTLKIVDVLIGYEQRFSPAAFRLLSSKLSFPGPDWNLVERQRQKLWVLDREVDFAVLRRGSEYSLTYAWRRNDRGWLRESLRSWLALDASPLRRERPRTAVRISAYAPFGGQLALDRAKQRMDRFVTDFREHLTTP